MPAESAHRAAPTTDWGSALAIQKNGELVVAGSSGSFKSYYRACCFAIARYSVKGKLDRTFGRDGKVRTDLGRSTSATAVAMEPDGRIAVAGQRGDRRGEMALARYTRSGALDSGFGRGGNVSTSFGSGSQASALAVQKDGKIVVAGTALVGRGSGGLLARYTVRGTLDTGFGRGGKVSTIFGSNSRVAAVAIQPDGKIVVAGVTFVAHRGEFAVARFTAAGKPDVKFGTSGKVLTLIAPTSDASAVALQADGKIVVAGGAGYADFALARYDADGRLDPTFGDGGTVVTDFSPTDRDDTHSTDRARAVAIQPDGKIVAAGSSDTEGRCDGNGHSCDEFALARYTVDGILDKSFGNGGKVVTHLAGDPSHRPSSSIAQAVAIQADGKIVAAGLGAGYDFGLARYTARGRLDNAFGSGGVVLTDFGSG
jgi:uncharacterized delta-60 repeat protein